MVDAADNIWLQLMAGKCNISEDDVLRQYEMVKKERQKIISEHKKNHRVWQATDQRWKTKVPTTDGKLRLLAKKNIEDLDQAIYEAYTVKTEPRKKKQPTIADLFPQWCDYKKDTGVTDNTLLRYKQYWNSSYNGLSIVSKPITEITLEELEIWACKMVEKHQMTRKDYNNHSVVMRGVFKVARKRRLITENLMELVEVEPRRFYKKPQYKAEERIFMPPEQTGILCEADKDFEKNRILSGLAVSLDFYTGCRAGELVALKWSDINWKEGYISIRRMEVRNQGNRGYSVVDHVKSDSGIRDIALCDDAIDLLNKIRRFHEDMEFNTEYIFVDGDGKRYHERAIVHRLEKYCGNLDIPVRRLHAVRRTYASNLTENLEKTGNYDIGIVQAQLGHADKSTTLSYYIYSRKRASEQREIVKKALNMTKICN